MALNLGGRGHLQHAAGLQQIEIVSGKLVTVLLEKRDHDLGQRVAIIDAQTLRDRGQHIPPDNGAVNRSSCPAVVWLECSLPLLLPCIGLGRPGGHRCSCSHSIAPFHLLSGGSRCRMRSLGQFQKHRKLLELGQAIMREANDQVEEARSNGFVRCNLQIRPLIGFQPYLKLPDNGIPVNLENPIVGCISNIRLKRGSGFTR